MTKGLILSIVGLGILTACDSPTPPSISAQDVLDANAEFERIIDLPETAAADLPPGSAEFNGHAGGEVSGDADGSVLGDMRMAIDFADNTISGEIDNINLIDIDDEPEQLLGGSLNIVGTETDGILSATASGELTAVGDESVRGSSTVSLTMSGSVLTDTADGDTVAGQLSGSGDGDFYINVFNGGFFGTSN